MTLLSIRNVSVGYRVGHRTAMAVEDASFDVDAGQTVGLIGESGCGKTTLASALLRLLPTNAHVPAGRVELEGVDVLGLSEIALRDVRWTKIAMIFQSAMNSLNPVRPVRSFLDEALRTHTELSADERRRRILECFELVGLPAERVNSYPHELSGGMKQRVVIALSLICNPRVVIADEPTTVLDVVVQDQVIGVIKSLQEQLGFALILISHDMALIAENCDDVAVMYAGQIVEHAETETIFANPRHPYTVGLLRSIPRLHGPLEVLPSLSGQPPDLLAPPPGCRFAPRCPLAICVDSAPALVDVGPDATSRCHFARDARIEGLLTGAWA